MHACMYVCMYLSICLSIYIYIYIYIYYSAVSAFEVGEATHKAAGGLKVPAEFRIKSREDPFVEPPLPPPPPSPPLLRLFGV